MVLKLFAFSGLLLLAPIPARAFVLLSGPTEARLPVSEAAPEITFMLSPKTPSISGQAAFADGAYADLDPDAFWLVLVEEAMRRWNDVNGSFVTLKVRFDEAAVLDSEDQIYSIVVSATNLTSSAFAKPKIVDSVIDDCDIAVSERTVEAKSLAFTLMHELGHCLGLGHNHGDYKAVMGYSRSDRSLRLGLDDEAGAIFLYPEASVGNAKELIHCGSLSGQLQTSHALLVFVYALPLFGLAWRLRRSVGVKS